MSRLVVQKYTSLEMRKIQMLPVGSVAPAFSLPDSEGKIHQLKECKGSWLVVYFYPKDDTPGCTVEACGLRDSWGDFAKNQVAVVGISADSVASHKKFQEKYQLPFTLLADVSKETLQKYQVWVEKSMFGKKYLGIQRSTYIINPQGKIAKVYPKVSPSTHAGMLLKDIAALKKNSGTP